MYLPRTLEWGLDREQIVRFTLQTRFSWLKVRPLSRWYRQLVTRFPLEALTDVPTLLNTCIIPTPVLLRWGFPREFSVVDIVEQALALEEAIMRAAKGEPPLLLRLVRSISVRLRTPVLRGANRSLPCSRRRTPLVAEQLACGRRTHKSPFRRQRWQERQSHIVSTGNIETSRRYRCSIPGTAALLGPLLQEHSVSI